VDGPDVYVSAGFPLTADCSALDPARRGGAGTLQWISVPVNVQPLFCDAAPCQAPTTGGVYTLDDDSELLDYRACGLIGALPQGCTMTLLPRSWGAIKSLYR
jgi:hypothetical protein